MKPVRDNVEVLERGTQLKVERLSIDEENMEFVMDMLATLYTNPAEAVVREYATNAWDSHVEAGNPDPIEVTLPSALERKLHIQDYGVGLSVDELYSMYKNYGSSTKRNSNDFTGMLGIGSKSGLSYNDSFTLRAVKDGRFAEIIVARNPDKGVAEMKLLAEGDTDERNGVRFSIDVIDVNEIRTAATKVFKYWKHGKVLVDGKPPVLVEEGNYIGHNSYLVGRDRWGEDSDDVIVMGNVAYPTDFNLREVVRDDRRVVHWADIGAVAVAPNREALKNINQTKRYIEEVSSNLKKTVIENVQKEVDKANSFFEAYLLARRTLNSGYDKMSWSGYGFDSTTAEGQFWGYATCYSWSGSASSLQRVQLDYNKKYPRLTQHVSDRNTVLVLGYDNAKFTAINAKKIRKLKGVEYEYFLFMEDGYDKQLFRNIDVVKYEDAKYIKIEDSSVKNVWSKPKTAGRYYVWDAFKEQYELQDTYKDHKYIYYSTSGKYSRYASPRLLKQLYPEYIPVKMTANRFNKFEREHDNVMSAQDAVIQYRNIVDTQLTHADKLAIAHVTPVIQDKTKVLDPDVVAYIEEFEGVDEKRVKEARTLYEFGVPISAIRNGYDTKFDIRKKYPVVQSMAKQENRIEYVNALYLYRKDNNK